MDKNRTSPTDATPAHGVDPENVENAEHGIPEGVHDAEPMGLPTSERHQGETAPNKP